MGALEGVRLDLRVCLAPPAAFGNMGILKLGILAIWKSGNLDIWNMDICKFGIQANSTMKILKICVAQNVGKVRISRKIPPIFFMPYQAISHGPRKKKRNEKEVQKL